MKYLSTKWLSRAWHQAHRLLCDTSLNSPVKIVRSCSNPPGLVQDIAKKVDSFGTLVIDLPYNVEIKPVDPHLYPNMDTLLVKVLSKSKEPQKRDLLSVNITDVCDIRAIENDDNNDMTCLIETPVGYDIEAKTTREGQVSISDMVSNTINVQTEFGGIIVSKVQAKEISLSSSEGGSIKLRKSVQGNIEINTAKDGNVDADKCLGTQLDVSTEHGGITIGSNYCEKSTFSTLNGHVELNNLHMDSTVDINGSGSLNITCLDGSLQANLQESPAKIQIVRVTGDSNIQSRGDVCLSLPDDSDAKLILEGQELDVDPNINGAYVENKQFISPGNGPKFQVLTEKTVQVSRSNWMESLKLGKQSK